MAPRSILGPIDFSQASESALDYACSLASQLGATIHLVNAFGSGIPELDIMSETVFRQILDGHAMALTKLAESHRRTAPIGETLVKAGDARDVILETADQLHVDMICMGTHGRRGISRMFLGSVAEAVTRRSPYPVLLIPARKDEAA